MATSSHARVLFFSLAFLILTFGLPTENLAQGQSDKQYTENKPDLALRSEARIDPSTLAMSLEIPLGAAPGRAGTSVSSVLRYSSKQWRMKYAGIYQSPILLHTRTRPIFSENARSGWTSSLDAPWIEYTGRNQQFDCSNGSSVRDELDANTYQACVIARIHLHLPDGSSHELRKSDTPQDESLPNFSGTFYSTDGARMRFDSDSGVLYAPDGGRYMFGPEQTLEHYNQQELSGRLATQYVDRNGNTVSYSLTSVTDTLGRTYQNPLASNSTAGDQTYSVLGFNNQNLTYTLRWRYLADALRTPSPLAYTSNQKCAGPNYESTEPYLYEFTGGSTHICADADVFNPVVLAEVVLPNGRSYQLKYNSFGEIEKIIYPTGGYERFAYGKINQLVRINWPYDLTNRGVVQRWVNASGTGSDGTPWTYDSTGVHITITPPDGSGRTERFIHVTSSSISAPYGFDNPLAGMTYEETVFNSSNQMLQRTLTEWATETPAGSTYPRNPRVTRTTSLTFVPGGNALAATTTIEYDSDLNVIGTNHYDYVSVDAATAQTGAIGLISVGDILRRQETTYLVNDGGVDAGVRSSYRARNLIGLPSSSRVISGTIVAQSSISYDEAAYPLLTYGAITGWTDPGANTKRGNATSSASWLNTTGTWLQTHAQYDQAGNVRNTWDAKGNQSQVEYSSAYAYAYPTLTRTAVPDPSGQYGSNTAFTSTSVFDFHTGNLISTTDANYQTTTLEYATTDGLGNSNPLQRLTRVNNPDGGWTSHAYGQSVDAGLLHDYVRKLTALSASASVETWQFFDGLGRPVRTFLNEGGSPAVLITSDTQYDSLGRAAKVSNPYRSNGSGAAINPSGQWTTNSFDALSRVISVITPDNAVVSTNYSGATVTVTDQAGKQRRSIIDGLGRLKEIYEDPNGVNYLTSYSYDALDNLTSVTQGVQTRDFVYDSLKRLKSATNPESGMICYGTVIGGQCQPDGYDANGNLIYKTDARGVRSTYAYDALNRNTSVVYTNDSAGTPAVYRYYDGFKSGANNNILNSKGRLWQSETAGANASRTTINSFDATGRPSLQSQQFYVGAAWSSSFSVSREYNLVGGVTLQTYPSGHAVTYNYDAAGRLGDKDAQNIAFSGNLGAGGAVRSYSAGILYSSLGGMTQEQFVTDTPLYNKLAYNSRGQLVEIRASTTPNDSSWNRGKFINWYGLQCGSVSSPNCNVADNNGNLQKQQIFVPNSDGSSTSWYQQYDYDSLNRLQRVHEYTGSTSLDWQQEFVYDRYGNRRIEQDVTKSFGASINKKEFSVSTTNNRLGVPTGQTGTMSYDNTGNLTTDTYSGAAVTRSYDAENHMTKETQANDYVAGSYTYNAEGQRVRRKVGSVETWQVYGIEGELLAEYAANGSYLTPQKEFGYRNGQLLITAESVSQGGGATNTHSLSLNGSSTYLQIPAPSNSSLNITGPVTLEAWIKITASTGAQQAIMERYNGWPTGDGGYLLRLNAAGKLAFATCADSGNLDVIVGNSTVSGGVWHHVAGVFDGSQLRVYLDGMLDGSKASTFAPTSGTTNLYVGLSGGSHVYPFGGLIDEASISAGATYTSDFTPSTQLSAQANTRGLWKFDGQTANDSAGNNNGTLVSGSYSTAVPALAASNVALASNGATATAQNYTADVGGSHYRPADAIDGIRYAPPAPPPGDIHDFWRDEHGLPSWLQIEFNGPKTIAEIDVFTLRQDILTQADPSPTDTFNNYGVTAFDVQYWTGSAWQTVPGGSITNNNLVWKKLTFTPVTTSKVRVVVNAAVDGVARICEVEAWTTSGSASATANINWLVADQLGTPRLVFDKTGSLASVKRHDYLPFGEEVFAGTGARTTGQGYLTAPNPNGLRQKFTQKERDNETGLDYFGARYYSSTQGRFTGVDPLMASAVAIDPQSWNRYAHVSNNPLRFVDDDGQIKRDQNGNIIFDPFGGPAVVTHPGGRATVQPGYIYADNGDRIEAFRNTSSDSRFDCDCHGLTFADGQVWINDNQVDRLLAGDGYNRTNEPQVGDVAVYRENGNVKHSTSVVGVENGQVTVAGLGGTEPSSSTTTAQGAWPGATVTYYRQRTDNRTPEQRQSHAEKVQHHIKAMQRIGIDLERRLGPPPPPPPPPPQPKRGKKGLNEDN